MKLILPLVAVASAQNVLAGNRNLSIADCNHMEQFALNFITGPVRHMADFVITKILRLMPHSAGACQYVKDTTLMHSCLDIPSFPRDSTIENRDVLFVTGLNTLSQRDVKLSCGAQSGKWGLQVSVGMDVIGVAMSTKKGDTYKYDTCEDSDSCSVYNEDQMFTAAARLACSPDKMRIGIKFDKIEFDQPIVFTLPNGNTTSMIPVIQEAINDATDRLTFNCPDNFVSRPLCHAMCKFLL